MRAGRPSVVGQVVTYVVLSLLAVLFLLPFAVILRNAFSSRERIVAAEWSWVPDRLGTENLQALFANDGIGIAKALINSTVVTLTQTVATVVVCLMAGFALARWEHRASRIILGLTVFTLMVPATVTFLPSFIMTASLGWIDSYRGLVIPVMWSAFATFLFRQSFLGFPRELEEAALLDGANPWTTFWRIVVPPSTGIIGAVSVITFLGSWNGFLWPTLVSGDNTRTVQVALSRFMTSQGVDYPMLFAGALVATIPVLLVFLFLQRYLVQGTESSGID